MGLVAVQNGLPQRMAGFVGDGVGDCLLYTSVNEAIAEVMAWHVPAGKLHHIHATGQ